MAERLDQTGLRPANVALSDLSLVIREGWRLFRAAPLPSLAYASVAALIGLVLLYAVGRLGVSPMSLPFAGGFMLVAPAMLGGFFRLAQCLETNQDVTMATPFAAFLRTPLQTWMVSLFCAFIFLIWITDAGVLYSFIIGGTDLPYELPWLIRVNESIAGFWFWGALMGSVLAFIIFTISAFSVPLLFEGRGGLVQVVHASVRAVFANFVVTMLWALILSLSILVAIMLLPLLLVVLPVMAYASFALYRIVFPSSN
ncbi:MAG: hypothetical protein B6D72_00530 [gamma proteobacterium symbiont of Ctena orbiculata]|nr:MAG: hypothetical protein B6D82_02630 [gamma proteobacterium symbiont of Ctena orbiculata]PVV16539.1 MAG: hypothetical protein B6D72_00530 [gamma proteobacterium symbiont of Ctena orbiculata]PVV26848.1 MAG: hypothetical protein B6D74_00465 [gamma proteobacterium symbiont of Ctena orbiculata]